MSEPFTLKTPADAPPAAPGAAQVPAVDASALSREAKMQRAHEADRLMNHPLLKEAFANLRLNYFEAFCQTPPEDVHGRDRIFHCGRVLDDVMTHLRIVLTAGAIEKAQITRRDQRGG